MKLRDYQIQTVTEIYQAWENGAINVCAQLPTGAGKTVIFSHIINEFKSPSIAIAHRIELVSQISLALARCGIRHDIVAQKNSIREIIQLHLNEFGHHYYNPHALVKVAGVDTLIRLPSNTEWFKRIGLVVQDEAHHVLRTNKWGTAANLFQNARGLYPTATPVRADGKGLGTSSDGILDALIQGPPMRKLISEGYLSDYRIFAPPSDLDLSQVTLSAGGDYSPPKLRKAVHKSHITGDVVSHYKRIAKGKLGITFAVDIEAATEIAQEFRAAGVPSEVISSKTPDLLRSHIMRRFRNREILQLVNVDLLGEGVDVPAIEVVSMARPTQSYGLYSQQFGRALRPLPGKTHAIIIDHVSNVVLHGLPDAPRTWSLDRRERKRSGKPGELPIRTCLDCFAVYSSIRSICPECGHKSEPQSRTTIAHVDGDLFELSPDALAALRGEISRIDAPPRIPQNLPSPAQIAIANKHRERQDVQKLLRDSIALWAGYFKAEDIDDSTIYRLFYYYFKTDIATAQTLNAEHAMKLAHQIQINIDGIENKGIEWKLIIGQQIGKSEPLH